MKIRVLAMAMIAVALSACGQPSTPEQKSEFAGKDISEYLFYVQDNRTGLCFARSTMRGGFYVYSPVECTEEVKRNLINPAK